MNRRMPNGMYGGVRGERKSPLLDCQKEENLMEDKAKVIENVEEVNEKALQELSDGKGEED